MAETDRARRNGDYIFPSKKLGGVQPRSGSMLVEDYLRPAAVRARVLKKLDMTLYYSHSRRKQKLAAQEKVLRRLLPQREQRPIQSP